MLFGLAKLLTGGLQVTKWAELILKKKIGGAEGGCNN